MKQRFHSYGLLFIFLLFLLSSCSTAARLLAPREGEEEMKDNGTTHGYPLKEKEEEDSMNLMGVEDCENEDEECLKRRMVSEAHLDYIYTQHHKP